ncbi:hypothetical protein [Aquirufa sp.]|jgi:tetratricopeptide (TPR) repeat protein|uniref:hypothetical protein n=1 Tax=Aquirufa sp. TaxID=2676249 RepID=UPI0037BF8016
MNRREIILQEIENNPNNPLNYYFLAIEERSIGNLETSIEMLKNIIDKFPEYQPSYYTIAELLYELDRTEEGTFFAKKGILIANKLHLTKVVNELESLILIND